jgi:hypothetical protein
VLFDGTGVGVGAAGERIGVEDCHRLRSQSDPDSIFESCSAFGLRRGMQAAISIAHQVPLLPYSSMPGGKADSPNAHRISLFSRCNGFTNSTIGQWF